MFPCLISSLIERKMDALKYLQVTSLQVMLVQVLCTVLQDLVKTITNCV